MKVKSRGLCSGHYIQWQRKREPRPLARTSLTLEQRFWAAVGKSDGCWTWHGSKTAAGYGTLGSRETHVYAHRYSYALVHGPIPSGLHILHHCDNPPCVNPAHLFLGTHQDNMRDMRDKGRNYAAAGEAHPRAKITENDVIDMRSLWALGALMRDLAAEYGLDDSTVFDIVRGNSWKRVPGSCPL